MLWNIKMVGRKHFLKTIYIYTNIGPGCRRLLHCPKHGSSCTHIFDTYKALNSLFSCQHFNPCHAPPHLWDQSLLVFFRRLLLQRDPCLPFLPISFPLSWSPFQILPQRPDFFGYVYIWQYTDFTSFPWLRAREFPRRQNRVLMRFKNETFTTFWQGKGESIDLRS